MTDCSITFLCDTGSSFALFSIRVELEMFTVCVNASNYLTRTDSYVAKERENIGRALASLTEYLVRNVFLSRHKNMSAVFLLPGSFSPVSKLGDDSDR